MVTAHYISTITTKVMTLFSVTVAIIKKKQRFSVDNLMTGAQLYPDDD